MAISLKKNTTRIYWLLLIFSVFAIKIFIFSIDPTPMFFLGDSVCYIDTALYDKIHPDRSFVYGFIIKFTALASHSLTTLVILQVITSGFNALMLAYILRKFFLVSFPLTFICTLLCAVEPIQLMYERYVMTEAYALFMLSFYILFALQYLKSARLGWMLLLQIIGVILISLRLSFLPLVLLSTFFLPFLAIPSLMEKFSLKQISFLRNFKDSIFNRSLLKIIVVHVAFSVCITYTLHIGYRHLNGILSENPPAYIYKSGAFLLSAFAPVIKPTDFPSDYIAEKVLNNLELDLKNRFNRAEHHFSPNGLISKIDNVFPDPLSADNVAKKIALNALSRDPLGVVLLSLRNYGDYWNFEHLRWITEMDRGSEIPLPENFLKSLQNEFNLRANDLPFLKTFTNQYYFNAKIWYLFLLCTPFMSMLALFLCDQEIRHYLLFVLLAIISIFIVITVATDSLSVRYFHSFGWIIFLIVGPLADQLSRQIRREKIHTKNTYRGEP